MNINKQNTILARGLRGNEIEKKLAEIFGAFQANSTNNIKKVCTNWYEYQKFFVSLPS
jgi:hypothetical protein